MTEAGYDVGEAFLRITPNFAGVADAITRQAEQWGSTSGQAFARRFNDEVRRGTNGAPLGPSDQDSARQGDRSAGKFADGYKAKITAALKALPDVEINADSSEADVKIAHLREQLVALSSQRVGIDIDEAEAKAKLAEIRRQLDEIGSSSTSARVKVDTAEASAQLAELKAKVDSVKDSTNNLSSTSASPGISINTGPALSALQTIKTAILGLSAGAVVTPLIGGAASLLGPLAAAGGGLAGVFGASLPGLSAVKDAYAAQGAAATAAGKSTTNSASAQVSAANQIKSAQLSLADTERRVANDRISQQESIKKAEQGVAAAQQQAAQQVAQADQQAAQAAQQVVSANQQVTTAEQSLASAQRSSLAAQKALTDAREAGARSLQDQAFAAQDAALQLQQDQLALVQAVQNKAAVDASATSTDLQRQQAALAVQQAQQALAEQQVTLARATEDNTKAQAAGIAGTPQVVAAQQQITSTQQAAVAAQQRLAQAQQQLAAAQKAQQAAVAADAQARTHAAQQVAAAEQSLADARRAASQQQAQDASDLQRAHMAVTQAQISAAAATATGASATNGLAEAMAKLTPSERTLLDQTNQFKTAFSDFGKALEPTLLPLFGQGLKILTDLLPTLEPLIRATAAALKPMLQSLDDAIKGPGFAKFMDTLTKLAGPSLTAFGQILGDLARLFGGLIEAFAPLAPIVLGGLHALTSALATAVGSPAVKQFVAMLVQIAPLVLSTFKAIGSALGAIFKALEPLAAPVLSIIKTLATALAGIVTAIGPSITALFKTLAPAINAVLTALAPIITEVVKTLAPVIGTLGTALAHAFVALAPVIEPVARLIGAVVTALAPLLPIIGQMIATLLPPLADLFTQIVQAISPLVPVIGQMIATLLPPLVQVIGTLSDALVPVITQLVGALQPVLPQIAAALGQFFVALTPIIPILGHLLASLIPLLPPFADLVVQVLKLATQLLPILLPLLRLLPPVLGVVVDAIKFVVRILTDLVKWVGEAITWFQHFGTNVSKIGQDVAGVWDSVWKHLKSAWADVSGFLSKAWKDFAGTASKLWDGIAGGIGKAFGAVKSTVTGIWNDVKRIFADSVNFVTQDILNPLIRILDDVLGVFGVHVSPISKITVSDSSGSSSSSGGGGSTGRKTSAFALGGVLPGYSPGIDNITIPKYHFSGGEGILVPEATRALGGPAGIQAINAQFSNRVSASGHFAGGGTLGGNYAPGAGGGILDGFASGTGSVYSGISSAIDDIKKAIREGAADAAIAALKVAEAPIKALLGTAGSPFAKKLATGVFNKLNSSVYDFISGHVKAPTAGPGGTIPTGDHLSLIQQALGVAGVSDTAANEKAVNIIVSYESGWNPAAINLTDSNAVAGHPSQGLMQTIPSTFEAYRAKSLPDNITDPLANLVAGIRYAVSRYGSLQTEGVNNIESGKGGYVGYDSGGYLPPGITTVFNGTGRPEPVFTPAQFAQMAQGGGVGDVSVYIGNEAIDSRFVTVAHSAIDGRVSAANERAARGVRAVPGRPYSHLER